MTWNTRRHRAGWHSGTQPTCTEEVLGSNLGRAIAYVNWVFRCFPQSFIPNIRSPELSAPLCSAVFCNCNWQLFEQSNNSPLDAILRQFNLVHISKAYLSNIHFNIILSRLDIFHPGGVFPWGFASNTVLLTVWYPMRALCPAHKILHHDTK
jgi:hypothetical protein